MIIFSMGDENNDKKQKPELWQQLFSVFVHVHG